MRPLPMLDTPATATPRRLSYHEARLSPCLDCPTSPCCTYLLVQNIPVTTLLELDYAIYLLNFDRIELGLSIGGEWSVYYRYPCRFLDHETFACTIHKTPEQPHVCAQYNDHDCWYRRAMTPSAAPEFLRIDRQRMRFIVDRVVLDEARAIVEVPTWPELVEAFAAWPPRPNDQFDPPLAASDDAFQAWERSIHALEPPAAPGLTVHGFRSPALRDPCLDCAAYCCTTLTFPFPRPATTVGLDYLQYSLGFPGVELGIAGDDWMLTIATTCRHLQERRCGVYGQAERPLRCTALDAWTCVVRPRFSQARPEGFLRVPRARFAWLAECIPFDQTGAILQIPPLADLRAHIEERWRQHGPTPPPAASAG